MNWMYKDTSKIRHPRSLRLQPRESTFPQEVEQRKETEVFCADMTGVQISNHLKHGSSYLKGMPQKSRWLILTFRCVCCEAYLENNGLFPWFLSTVGNALAFSYDDSLLSCLFNVFILDPWFQIESKMSHQDPQKYRRCRVRSRMYINIYNTAYEQYIPTRSNGVVWMFRDIVSRHFLIHSTLPWKM